MLLPYQTRWLEDDSSVKVIEKSRRVGISWTTAMGAVMTALDPHGSDVWYIGYNEDMGIEFVRDCAKWVRLFNALHPDKPPVTERNIKTKQIAFPSSYRITAVSSLPRNLRGKQGMVILDEAAFHDDLPGILKASLAVQMLGGRVLVISTHYGEDSPFDRLVQSVRRGERPFSLHRVTIDDAIADGYCRVSSMLSGQEVSAAEWRAELFDSYGEFAEEELLCVPARAHSTYFARGLVVRASVPGHVVRVDDDGSLFRDESSAAARANDVLGQLPLDELSSDEQHVIGVDVGRVGDITAICIFAVARDLRKRMAVVLELHNAAFRLQEHILRQLSERCPHVVGIAVDGTGNGSALAEQMCSIYGGLAEDVKITQKWYAQEMPRLRRAMESGELVIPRDIDIQQDFATVRVEAGIPRIAKSKAMKGDAIARGKRRHGDTVIGAALALSLSCRRCGEFTGQPGGYYARGGTHRNESRGWL